MKVGVPSVWRSASSETISGSLQACYEARALSPYGTTRPDRVLAIPQ
jgi:hypothetical protein